MAQHVLICCKLGRPRRPCWEKFWVPELTSRLTPHKKPPIRRVLLGVVSSPPWWTALSAGRIFMVAWSCFQGGPTGSCSTECQGTSKSTKMRRKLATWGLDNMRLRQPSFRAGIINWSNCLRTTRNCEPTDDLFMAAMYCMGLDNYKYHGPHA